MTAPNLPASPADDGPDFRRPPPVEMVPSRAAAGNFPALENRGREQHYQEFSQALPAAVYTCDLQGRITSFNAAAATLWGREPVLGTDRWCGAWRIYEPDGRPVPREDGPLAVLIRQGQPGRGREVVIERPDGQRCPVLPHPQLLRDAAGVVVGAVNLLVDLTERKRTEDTLRASEELLRRVMDSSHDCIKLLDLDGRLLWMNACGLRVMEIENFQTLAHASWLEFWTGEDQVAARAAVAAACANGVGSFTGFCPTATGVAKWWEVVITPVRNAAGQPEKLLAISRDLTERRRAEEAVRNSTLLYHSLVESLPHRIFRKDGAGRFIFANQRFCRTLGRSLAEVLGRTDADFFPPDLAAKYRADDLRVLETGQPWEGEEEHRDALGNTLHVQVSKTRLLDTAGLAVGVQGVFTDITERKQAEAARAQRTAELERLHRLSVGRELQMIELKQEINELAKLAGRTPPYAASSRGTKPTPQPQP